MASVTTNRMPESATLSPTSRDSFNTKGHEEGRMTSVRPGFLLFLLRNKMEFPWWSGG